MVDEIQNIIPDLDKEVKKYNFWKSFLIAVETEPREANPIRGASGLSHPVIAVGVDDNRKRIVIVSGDPDGRTAALAQADIQAALKTYKVIVARPIGANLFEIAQSISRTLGKTLITFKDLEKYLPKNLKNGSKAEKFFQAKFQGYIQENIVPSIQGWGYASLNFTSAVQDVILQLSHLELITNSTLIDSEKKDLPTIELGGVIALDPAELDRRNGIASIPLYCFKPEEAEIFHSGNDIEYIKEILKIHNIYQYFFPAPDQLAIALIENQDLKASEALNNIMVAPEEGHPLGKYELVDSNVKLNDLVEALQQKGLVVEGEFGYELSESGRVVRSSVKFTTKEGLIQKLSRIISLKMDINLKDLIK